jgi:hypothetical protein
MTISQISVLLTLFALLLYIIFKPAPKRPPQWVCTICHSAFARPKATTPGSMSLEIVLWLCFLLPGLFYSIWRMTARHKACPECGSKEFVPIKSPRGRILAGGQPQ